MKKILASVALAAAAATLVAGPAEATRPMLGYSNRDVCWNIKGVQPVSLLVGGSNGSVRLNEATKRPHDCIVFWKHGR